MGIPPSPASFCFCLCSGDRDVRLADFAAGEYTRRLDLRLMARIQASYPAYIAFHVHTHYSCKLSSISRAFNQVCQIRAERVPLGPGSGRVNKKCVHRLHVVQCLIQSSYSQAQLLIAHSMLYKIDTQLRHAVSRRLHQTNNLRLHMILSSSPSCPRNTSPCDYFLISLCCRRSFTLGMLCTACSVFGALRRISLSEPISLCASACLSLGVVRPAVFAPLPPTPAASKLLSSRSALARYTIVLY